MSISNPAFEGDDRTSENSRVSLAVGLFSAGMRAKEDWRRWARNTGDPHAVQAVEDAITALEKAHKVIVPREVRPRRRKPGKESERE